MPSNLISNDLMKGATPHTPLAAVLQQYKEAEVAWAHDKVCVCVCVCVCVVFVFDAKDQKPANTAHVDVLLSCFAGTAQARSSGAEAARKQGHLPARSVHLNLL